MLLYRKDEIVQKAAESNQLAWDGRTPVQFVHDYYNEDWHVKAGTLAYIKVGTVVTTIEEFDGKESVKCRIIADLAAGKDTVEIPSIAFDDGTLLVKDEKSELLPYSEVFASPFDGELIMQKIKIPQKNLNVNVEWCIMPMVVKNSVRSVVRKFFMRWEKNGYFLFQ